MKAKNIFITVKKIFLIILFSSPLILAKAQGISKDKITDKGSEEPKIAILSLKIIKSGDLYSAMLKNFTLVNTGKSFTQAIKTWNENDFICFILDERKQILDTVIIHQPLKVRYEFPTDNETIGSKTVDLPENEVLLRFGYSAEMKYLSIARVGENRKLENSDIIALQNK